MRTLLTLALATLFVSGCKTGETTDRPAAPESPDTAAPKAEPAAPSLWPAQFAALTDGAQFELHSEVASLEPITTRARVVASSATAIRLSWERNGMAEPGYEPTLISRTDASVAIDSEQFPLAKTGVEDKSGNLVFGNQVSPDNPIVCYALVPEPGTDCDDLCFATACFHPDKGIVYLEGNWGPEQRTAVHPDCVGPPHLLFCDGPAEN